MFGFELDDVTGEELVRFVRALGKHRYVDGRLHVVHALAVEAAHVATADPALDEAAAWAARVTSGPIDLATKDERLFRKATDAELVGVLDAFWSAGERRSMAVQKLRARLASIDVDVDAECARPPFDEEREDDVFPILVDAGWELLPIARFDRERHRGAIDAFGDDVGWEGAKFEEENAIPPLVHLHELPVLGTTELLAALDPETGKVRAPFVLWQDGNETYLDYLLRGVLRASRLEMTGGH
jgi:hypothetical protein